MRSAFSQFMEENYNFNRTNTQVAPADKPTKPDFIDQIVAKKEPEIQLQYLVKKVDELNQEDADFIVYLHRQQQQGEAFSDELKAQLAALANQIA